MEEVSKLGSSDQKDIKAAADFIENMIDEIDQHNEDAAPCKDIVTVCKAKYEESFPASANVCDRNATMLEAVKNPEFYQIPILLSKYTPKTPIIITSVRKPTQSSGQLQFGKQYVVDGFDKQGVRKWKYSNWKKDNR